MCGTGDAHRAACHRAEHASLNRRCCCMRLHIQRRHVSSATASCRYHEFEQMPQGEHELEEHPHVVPPPLVVRARCGFAIACVPVLHATTCGGACAATAPAQLSPMRCAPAPFAEPPLPRAPLPLLCKARLLVMHA